MDVKDDSNMVNDSGVGGVIDGGYAGEQRDDVDGWDDLWQWWS